jgi:hypothetical protein
VGNQYSLDFQQLRSKPGLLGTADGHDRSGQVADGVGLLLHALSKHRN